MLLGAEGPVDHKDVQRACEEGSALQSMNLDVPSTQCLSMAVMVIPLFEQIRTNHPQLPLKTPEVPTNKDHEALNRGGALGGLRPKEVASRRVPKGHRQGTLKVFLERSIASTAAHPNIGLLRAAVSQIVGPGRLGKSLHGFRNISASVCGGFAVETRILSTIARERRLRRNNCYRQL